MTAITYDLKSVSSAFMYDTGRSTVEEGYVDCAEGAIDVLLAWDVQRHPQREGARLIDQYDARTIKKIFDLYHVMNPGKVGF